MALQTKDDFVAEFEHLRSSYLRSALGRESADLFTQDSYKILGGFIFEIYRNTIEHGCRDLSGDTIKGIRYVRLQKDVDVSLDALLRRAQPFIELRNFLAKTFSRSRGLPFYEVSISDHGQGIINRFLGTCPEVELDEDSVEGRVRLISRIIAEALSSKEGVSGAGHGLERALEAFPVFSQFGPIGCGCTTRALTALDLVRTGC